ncbi:MAG: N-acetyltransferase [Planctomycetota bacterium]|jgi:amino-acid N-acetyltransferase
MAEETDSMSSVELRKATVLDASDILDLVNRLALEQIMLPRSPASVLENIRDFLVVEIDGKFAGCGALHVCWSDMAEIRSIAVAPEHQGLGLGRKMAEEMIREAEQLGLPRVFAFTYVPDFFHRMGFEVVEHASLPHKVFNDCLNCPKYQACDEIAVMKILKEDAVEVLSSMPLPKRP